jgi:hypothetical protein
MVVLFREHLNVFVEAAMIPLIKEVDWSETKYVLGVFGLQSDILLRRLGELASPGGSAPRLEDHRRRQRGGTCPGSGPFWRSTVPFPERTDRARGTS